MAKIENDKYYTSIELANYCWDKVIEIIGEENISEIIEPSCGNGAFYHHDKLTPHFGYDIEPEFKHQGIIKGNFLEQDIKYLYGRLSIGNPPYGAKMNLARSFYNKCVEISDYIAFILPISQLNNTQSLYKFDLVYSEDLGKRIYSDREVHCCFNIYKRPTCGLNNKSLTKLKDIKIYRQDSKNYEDKDFDLRLCYWGNGSAGKILKDDEHYSAEYKIKILNDDLKADIIKYLTNFDWKDYLKSTAMLKIQQHHIINVLIDKFPQLKMGVNTKINYKNALIDTIEIRESIKNSNPHRNKDILDFNYDIRMIAWGDVGRFLTKTDKRYAKEFYIKINDLKNKDKIISLLQNANWKELYPMTVTPNLLQWQVYKYIGENINKLNIKEK